MSVAKPTAKPCSRPRFPSGSHCPLAKLGHDKEQVKGRPLIQIALAVTQKEGFPLFHKVFDGNVHDARTLQDSVTQFRGYHLRPGLFIYDRGIVSGRNVKDVKQLHWDTLCGIDRKSVV